MMHILRRHCTPLAVAGLLSLMSGSVLAANGDTTTINITGTLIDAPECTVNSNDKVDVSFGNDIITYQVSGENYKKQIPYNLTCTSLSQQGLIMTLNGTGASFNSALFKTDKTGLGIRILSGTSAVSPGGTVAFNYTNQPVLYAVLVAQDTSTLTTGTFSGTATMVIAYQ